jgi:hypothetical protein
MEDGIGKQHINCYNDRETCEYLPVNKTVEVPCGTNLYVKYVCTCICLRLKLLT